MNYQPRKGSPVDPATLSQQVTDMIDHVYSEADDHYDGINKMETIRDRLDSASHELGEISAFLHILREIDAVSDEVQTAIDTKWSTYYAENPEAKVRDGLADKPSFND